MMQLHTHTNTETVGARGNGEEETRICRHTHTHTHTHTPCSVAHGHLQSAGIVLDVCWSRETSGSYTTQRVIGAFVVYWYSFSNSCTVVRSLGLCLV